MAIVRLLYASHCQLAPGQSVFDFSDASERNNKRDAITGALAFNQHYFLQVLEGGSDAVNATFQRICRDKRHEQIVLIDYSTVGNRQFEHWSMRFLNATEASREMLLRFGGSGEFRPQEMDQSAAIGLLTALTEQS
jgi:hypothetical protein